MALEDLTPDEKRKVADEMNELAQLEENARQQQENVEDQMKLASLFGTTYVMSEYEQIELVSKTYNINASEAKKALGSFPKEYMVDEQTIPDLVRKMRMARRKLKGEQKIKMSKSIDSIIDAYSDHLNKCIDSIHWVSPYKLALKKMNYDEKTLLKLSKMKDTEIRRDIINSICKYWEAELEQDGMAYGTEFSNLQKQMNNAKREFKEIVKSVSDQSIVKTKREKVEDFVLKAVCENNGINARGIHDRMPRELMNYATPNTISKMIKKLDIVSLNGNYYKFSSEIKKNIWAYTAAFIDSDGYITLDRKMNPRVGLVATGERGKAFMKEMHKSIGFGRMHLDQKSPQDTRLINRLNFYSQDDVTELMTKCLPHFRLKKGNAKLLLELIRMKKSYKKQDWYKQRCDEIFKLMKWENHKDHVGFDWAKENIDLENISKYQDNCKMSLMDSMEQIGTIVG